MPVADVSFSLADMYGRIFESLYRGSMIGSGSVVFAVWPYVIANMRADSEVGAQVDLNPKLLAAIFGEKEGAIEEAIEKLCAPDPESTSKEEQGRRLVRVGQFAYRVVNGEHYLKIANLEQKREYDRNQKRKQRALRRGKTLPNEAAAVRAIGAGDQEHADRLAAERVATKEGILDVDAEARRKAAQRPQQFPGPSVAQKPAGVAEKAVPVSQNAVPVASRPVPVPPEKLPGGNPLAGGWAEETRPLRPAGLVSIQEALRHKPPQAGNP